MENRKIGSTPASDERSPKVKSDDFEPPENSGGPPVEDRPPAYDIDVAPPSPPAGVAGK
jgi:hypothetical protein